MNPKYERAADRLRGLIDEGMRIARKLEGSPTDSIDSDLHAWKVRSENIVQAIFREKSAHYRQLKEKLVIVFCNAATVRPVVGILKGALDDLEGGFMIGQEHLIAGEIFDSILDQAKTLLKAGYKDCAAILGRVVAENTLQRLCRDEGLDDTAKATKLNEDLWKKGRYGKPQWRIIQSWLDIGNAAAHGEFDQYTDTQVQRMIDVVERFIAQEFAP